MTDDVDSLEYGTTFAAEQTTSCSHENQKLRQQATTSWKRGLNGCHILYRANATKETQMEQE
jgi:hypothetical protein